MPGFKYPSLSTNKQKKPMSGIFKMVLKDYLADALKGYEVLPNQPFTGELSGTTEGVDWAVLWLPEGGEAVTESYVNLIPTAQGGTHVNGLRQGLLEAMREFCEFRNLLPRGVKFDTG